MSDRDFVFHSVAQRVRFAAGSSDALATELEQLGARRALVLCTPEQRALADGMATRLGDLAVGVYDGAVMHVPVETARAAQQLARSLGADCAVAVGGGSTIGLGKAIALDCGLPILAVPTTYAGSEMTPIYGLTEGGLKRTGKDVRVLPRTVIYDPQLTLSLPVEMSITSALNALAHAAEGLYAADGNPVMDLMAQEGIRSIARAVPVIASDPRNLAAREDALKGAWLCGAVLGSVGMALHHKLCHTLGGSFNLPHAAVHTVVLAHALAYNSAAAPQAMHRIAQAMGLSKAQAQEPLAAAQAVFDLAQRHGAPTALQAIGMQRSDLRRARELAMQAQYPNPRPLEADALDALLLNAFEGRRPG
ncbi:MAG: maleylacetate reductase [Pigmentiphaga sp.]|uniref:maleylacetate reductase n=1 Tax=Alicycliphilus denitrificans TaxID=179636 RepID=UPI0009673A65|nr:maleylacetate reductase [Alicycliphilus denitrificans]MBN9575154.1 maleylacetate reductase [Alicycliphilus denitrificans]OJW84706.1 MAG: maleylacetate reductase [Alicycliphilus sp. 69-12]BCN40419.1 maleylacetate reductase [Alicycliphilus denitrificans]